jgi:hypothetical protein
VSDVDDTGRLYMSSFSASLGNWAREDKPREGHDGSQVMIPTGFGVGKSKGTAEEHPVETDKERYAKAGPHWMLHFHRYQPLALAAGCFRAYRMRGKDRCPIIIACLSLCLGFKRYCA